MISLAFQAQVLPVTSEMRWRHRFSILTLVFTTILLSWGAVVTSIEAGLAVPDWPTSFNSIDPVNPIPRWWAIPAILAEHGHRLMGLIVGNLVIVLTVWTLLADPRRWIKYVAVASLLLVMMQGVLGGLRVVWVSLDLAVIHACVAQLFFSTLVALTLFTAPAWLKSEGVLEDNPETYRFRRVALMTSLGIYIQIIMGALLRHPGAGSQLVLVITHLIGAFLVLGLVYITVRCAKKASPTPSLSTRFAHVMAGLLAIQIVLGFGAYVLITIDEFAGRGVFPTILSTVHMVTGALLMASSILVVLSGARYAVVSSSTQPAARPLHSE